MPATRKKKETVDSGATKRKAEDDEKDVKEEEEEDAPKDYNKMTVAQLRDELKKKNLEIKGIKSELIERLKQGGDAKDAADEKEDEEEEVKEKTATKEKAPAKKAKKSKEEEEDGKEGAETATASALPTTTDFSVPKLEENQLKISSWNVAGWNSVIGKGFSDYVKNENPDIMCVQETKIDPSNVPENYIPGYFSHFVIGQKKGYSGTGIFSKVKPIKWIDGIGVPEHDGDGRVITAEYENFFLVNSYIPNSGKALVNLDYRKKWDKDFLEYLKKLDAQKPVIWTGDLNVAHLEIDLTNPKTNKNKTAGFSDAEREGMTNVLNAGFVDSFRHLYPDKKDTYSYWSYFRNARSKNIGWRLDYFIISKRIVEKLGDTYMRPAVTGSDHCPIVCHLALK